MREIWTGLTHEEKIARGKAKLAAMRAGEAGVVFRMRGVVRFDAEIDIACVPVSRKA